ncbi:MAG: hypothetical protein ACE5KJ_00090 [Candidatus Zixiibacteriota bacterium]
MRRIKKTGITFGFIFFILSSFLIAGLEAEAGVLDFDFTYTSADTVDSGQFGDTTTFQSILENTGTEADSYVISMTINPPTPVQWIIWFCSGGVCHPPGVTQDTVYLDSLEQDLILVEMAPRIACGTGSVTITVTSIGNPNLSESITFLLHVYSEECPMTDRWGLFILISLLFTAGLYLIWKRSRPVRTTLSS